MPSYLDFNSTKNFRDYILGKNISTPKYPDGKYLLLVWYRRTTKTANPLKD